MFDDEKLMALRRLTGETDPDILSLYLAQAKSTVLTHAYPYNPEIEEVPARYDMVQIEIAVYLLNKRGAEGETSHSENGVSRTYADGDIPPSLLRRIIPMAGAVL